LYTAGDQTLYVYSVSDLTYPIATYQIDEDEKCFSVIITETYLYLGGIRKLQVYEVTTSLTQPLVSVLAINS
jgi:hypothetical protein